MNSKPYGFRFSSSFYFFISLGLGLNVSFAGDHGQNTRIDHQTRYSAPAKSFDPKTCLREITNEPNPGFSPQYISQIESSVREAYSMLSREETHKEVRLMLNERPPRDIKHAAFQGLIKNPDFTKDAFGGPHGEGTLAIMSCKVKEVSALPSTGRPLRKSRYK